MSLGLTVNKHLQKKHLPFGMWAFLIGKCSCNFVIYSILPTME